jgi:hypothetical protein
MAMNINTAIKLLMDTVFLLGPCKVVIRKTIGATQLVGSCQLKVEFAQQALKVEPQCRKLKNLHI